MNCEYGPSYWSALTDIVKEDQCIKILEKLKLKLHGKERRILRENINEAVRYRETLVKLGRTGQYIKSVLQESSNASNFDAIRDLDGGWKSMPEEVQGVFTEHYERYTVEASIRRIGHGRQEVLRRTLR
jgi:hypothetical protein